MKKKLFFRYRYKIHENSLSNYTKEIFLTFWSKNASNYTISQNIRVLLR